MKLVNLTLEVSENLEFPDRYFQEFPGWLDVHSHSSEIIQCKHCPIIRILAVAMSIVTFVQPIRE